MRAGDFAGLTNLQALHLLTDRGSALPPDLFAGLTDLQTLHVSAASVSALPPDLFAGLTRLATPPARLPGLFGHLPAGDLAPGGQPTPAAGRSRGLGPPAHPNPDRPGPAGGRRCGRPARPVRVAPGRQPVLAGGCLRRAAGPAHPRPERQSFADPAAGLFADFDQLRTLDLGEWRGDDGCANTYANTYAYLWPWDTRNRLTTWRSDAFATRIC